jgi:methionyl-tRNA synthetase
MKKKIHIGLSWPYANGRLHIGHVASSLPADAIARFHRAIGNDVSFVTGSDCYGTPILVKANQEGIAPEKLAQKYHEFHDKDFRALGFTFDNYDKTMSARHHEFVRQFHQEMYQSGFIYEKTAPQLYCEKCKQFLPDRYVEGICPHCKKKAKGDSCDSCGAILEPEDLLEPKCLLCGGTPHAKDQTQLYIKLSALQDKIREFYEERKSTWTTNAVGLTQRYLGEGLRDRAITRSLAWGVPVPREGWADRRIYIWAENVLGYFSASEPKFIEDSHQKIGKYRPEKSEILSYYVHGKDNIPFHGVILPGLLLAHGGGEARYHLPDKIISSEYITVGGDKLSKSKGNQIFAYTLYENFDVDMVRYFFLRTLSDKRDVNFTLEEFVNLINGELVNNFGNLVNRTLSFVASKFDRKIPSVKTEKDVAAEVEKCEKAVFDLMWAGDTAAALRLIMDLVNFGNKYFAEKKPWLTLDKQTIGEVIFIIRSCTQMLAPFIPNACEKIRGWLSGDTLPEIDVLWQRLELAKVKEVFEKK